MKRKRGRRTDVASTLTLNLVHVLRAPPPEFAKMEDKQKVPKPKWTKEVANDIQKVLEQRLERYPTTLQVWL